jgi:predicted DNA-binding transcriptional regulator AlpA
MSAEPPPPGPDDTPGKKPRKQKERQPLESLTVDLYDIADLSGIGYSTLERWKAAGKLPKPLTDRRPVRWLRSDVVVWIEAGMPPQKEWERLKTDRRKRGCVGDNAPGPAVRGGGAPGAQQER